MCASARRRGRRLPGTVPAATGASSCVPSDLCDFESQVPCRGASESPLSLNFELQVSLMRAAQCRRRVSPDSEAAQAPWSPTGLLRQKPPAALAVARCHSASARPVTVVYCHSERLQLQPSSSRQKKVPRLLAWALCAGGQALGRARRRSTVLSVICTVGSKCGALSQFRPISLSQCN